MKASRIANQVILTDSTEEIVERFEPEEALALAESLVHNADAILKATAEVEHVAAPQTKEEVEA